MQLYPEALLLAALLTAHGLRKGSLAVSGAVAAALVGYVSMASPLRSSGCTLIGFYLLGSRATKIGHEIKARLETEHAVEQRAANGKIASQHKAKSGGKRDATQVLCNSFVGALCALLFRLLYGDMRGQVTALDRHSSSIRPEALFFAMLGHYACCMGDTLASELGILAKGAPRLVLPPFRKVPRGTNGAVSVQGTLASLLGGAYIGLLASLSCVAFDNWRRLREDHSAPLAVILDNVRRALSGQHGSVMVAPSTTHFVLICIGIGALGGLLGSGIDSLLGATLQRTWYNARRDQVLLGQLPSSLEADKRKEWRIVTGYDVLSNSAINFVSSICTAVITAYIGSLLFSLS